MSHFWGDKPRTWKQWWSDVKYWFRCLAKDIEHEKYYRDCYAAGRMPGIIYGPRMVINWKTNKAKRVMPLEDIYNFTIGNFKKVLGLKPRTYRYDSLTHVQAPRVKVERPWTDLRGILAENGLKDFIDGPGKKDH